MTGINPDTLPELVDTPWSSETEIRFFFLSLFRKANGTLDEDISRLESLKQQLMGWLIKSVGYPDRLEIDSTLAIISAHLSSLKNDALKNDPDDQQHLDDYDLCSLYSMAVIRFCDMIKHYQMSDDESNDGPVVIKNVRSAPINRDTLEHLGIPEWILDLRHEACHTSTPSLKLLSQASFICLEWLKRHFWIRKVHDSRHISPCDTNSILNDFLNCPKDRNLSGVMSETLTDINCYKSIVDFMVQMASDAGFAEFSETIAEEIWKKFVPVISLVIKNGRCDVLLHELIRRFRVIRTKDKTREDMRQGIADSINKKYSKLWFKVITHGMSTRTDYYDGSKKCYRKKKLQDIYIPKNFSCNNGAFRMRMLKVVNRLMVDPIHETPHLLQPFQKMIPDLVPYDQLTRLSEAYLNPGEYLDDDGYNSGPSGNRVNRVSEKKLLVTTSIKTVEDLKKDLAEATKSPDKRMMAGDGTRIIRGILKKRPQLVVDNDDKEYKKIKLFI